MKVSYQHPAPAAVLLGKNPAAHCLQLWLGLTAGLDV
jgi:hypothetical protein